MSQKRTEKQKHRMSLNKNRQLRIIAKTQCRKLRRNSTRAEQIFWEQVRNRKFLGLKINRQFPIFYDTLGKETFFIADFYCHEKKLVIEIDGKIHKNQIEQDVLRTEILHTLGLKVIRFKNEEIEQNIINTLEKLKTNLKSPFSFKEKGFRDESKKN